jgi:hypothetical protein
MHYKLVDQDPKTLSVALIQRRGSAQNLGNENPHQIENSRKASGVCCSGGGIS